MCVLCCIITVMKTLDSKKKGARHQAQCSGTNWVEKLALPQCIFHRDCFKTKSQMEISTALWSKESAELPEKKKKRLHRIGFEIELCRSHCCCPLPGLQHPSLSH